MFKYFCGILMIQINVKEKTIFSILLIIFNILTRFKKNNFFLDFAIHFD